MKLFQFTISPTPPGMNQIIAAARRSPYASASQKKEWTHVVAVECWGEKIPLITVPIILRLDFYVKSKQQDPDNLSAIKKFILDGMQEAGVISGDSFKDIKGFVEFFHHQKGLDCVVVTGFSYEKNLAESLVLAIAEKIEPTLNQPIATQTKLW